MKNLLISTALAGAIAFPALAQDATEGTFLTERAAGSVEASSLIGARIYASEAALDADEIDGVQQDWSDIGEVNDVILSRDGMVDAVLVDVGGFLGIGERQVAVDMGALRFVSDSATDADDWFLVMTADRAALEGAPEWAAMGDAAGMQPAEGAATGAAAGVAAGAAATSAAADASVADPMTDDAITEGAADDVIGTDDAAGATADSTAGDPNAEVPAANEAVASVEEGTAAATAEGGTSMRDGYVAADMTMMTSETLTGAAVYDQNDESIGEISNLVLAADGQVQQVIVDVGGFLGIGEKPVAIDIAQMEILQADGGTDIRIYVPMTREELEALPAATEG